MLKKIAALLLVLVMCIAVVSCSKDKTPDGMYLVSIDGEPFKLYVHDAWTSNKSSGISGAFLSGAENIAVSARYYTPENSEQTLDEYVSECIEAYTKGLSQMNVTEQSPALLGGEDARQMKYTAVNGDTSFTFLQYITKYNGDFIVLTFRAPTEVYTSYETQFSEVKEEFVLCEKIESTAEVLTDKKTPEGMKIASSDVLEYRFYVPNNWICDPNSGVSETYYPESGKPNVTVTSFSPDAAMTAEEYFSECDKQYKEEIEGYELISVSDRTVAERAAKSYAYRAQYGETKLKMMQTVFVYNQMVYSITYTALEDSFDLHMEDVETMLDVFRFR